MAFILIKGTFHVAGYSPDGDSVRFEAHNSSNWEKLSGRPVELNARGHAQLRFEAIDTLETHWCEPHFPALRCFWCNKAKLKWLPETWHQALFRTR